MAESYPDLAEQEKLSGSLIRDPDALFYYPQTVTVQKAIMPGTTLNYKCSLGHGISDGTNPHQYLHCRGNRLVDGFDVIEKCQGKLGNDKKWNFPKRV